MKSTLRNVLAVVVGLLVGGGVNMGLIVLGPKLIPPPGGADVTTVEGLRRSLHLFEPKHFVFPFLAHAIGTLVGAVVTAASASSRRKALALLIGLVFLAGGVANSFMLPAPKWFIALDLLVAYIPMALLGARAGARDT